VNAGENRASIQFGAQFWSQATDWPAFRDIVLDAERAGWDSAWTWDHLLAIFGPWRQSIFEGWLSLAAWGAVTSRIRLGLMVGANTIRNPGLTAKLAATLDHITNGRAILGIGGAWFEREHDALGIDFGSGFGERLDRLEEAVGLMRRLLDGEEFDHDGRYYTMHEASLLPRPIQAHLPILIGGSGPQKTLRTVARHADGWNTSGPLDVVAERVRILRDHCRAEDRDPATIELTISFPMVIRDDPGDAERAFAAQMRHNGAEIGATPLILGSPALAAETIRPYTELGFRTVIARLPAPFDAETIARLGEVREAVAAASGG
jgi:alkanesulfonate monooxygenase SsuD/methylene tetrahydromethanopterin reductase-like flavin-dependent oxidoreductase (luciferase family)